jgi:subtilisin family serine protease
MRLRLLRHVLLAAAFLAACTPQSETDRYDIDPRLEEQIRNDEAPTAILSFDSGNEEAIEAIAEAHGAEVRVFAEFSLAALYNVRDIDLIIELMTDAGVRRAEADEVFYAVSSPSALDLIDQPEAIGLGHAGTGVTVAVLDTGVDYTLPDFGSCTAPGVGTGCRVVASVDKAPEDNQMDDAGKHGTNVAAIVANVAPGSGIAAVDVFDGNVARSSQVIDGLSWVVSNASVHDIRVVNLSIGGSTAYTAECDSTSLATAVRGVVAAGITVVSAAGNDGFKDSMTSPGCITESIAVGAVYPSARSTVTYEMCQDTSPVADLPTCFSNASPMLDVLAPGAAIPGGGIVMTGTSQATPHVAAAAAILQSADKMATPSDIRTAITSRGTPVTDPNNNTSYPRLDIDDALSLLNSGPTVPPTPNPLPVPQPPEEPAPEEPAPEEPTPEEPTPEEPTPEEPAPEEPAPTCTLTMRTIGMTGAVSAEGATFAAQVDVADGCEWTLEPSPSWVFPSAVSGKGATTLEWTVLENFGADVRTAEIGFADAKATIAQSAGFDPVEYVMIDGGMPVTESSTVTIEIVTPDYMRPQSICVSTETWCTAWQPFSNQVTFDLPSVPGTHTVTVWLTAPNGILAARRLTDEIELR